jgi:hypothetical protein
MSSLTAVGFGENSYGATWDFQKATKIIFQAIELADPPQC